MSLHPGSDKINSHQPYIPSDQSPAEFSLKSVSLGIVFGIVFGAANAYLGLKAGLTIATSIPVAVILKKEPAGFGYSWAGVWSPLLGLMALFLLIIAFRKAIKK